MSDVQFTIIMPVYNSERYIAKAVESILAQTYKSFQLILVDDGSTDNSSIICDEFARQYENIVVYHKKNGGICSARNYGMDKICGKYVYFMDNDDTLRKDALKIIKQALSEDEETDILMFGSCLTNIEKGQITSTVNRVMGDFKCCSREDYRQKLLNLLQKGMLLCVWDKVYRTDFLMHAGVKFDSFFTHGGEDLDFNLQLIKQMPRLKNINQVLYEYYIRDIQSTYRKFNVNVYIHAIRNLNTIQDVMQIFDIKNTDYLYGKYIEYRLRLLFMLQHSQADLDYKKKIKICRNEFGKDGYKPQFRIKALFYYIVKTKTSIQKKILVAINFMHMYRISFWMIDLFKRKQK